jgi:hypothetical protein
MTYALSCLAHLTFKMTHMRQERQMRTKCFVWQHHMLISTIYDSSRRNINSHNRLSIACLLRYSLPTKPHKTVSPHPRTYFVWWASSEPLCLLSWKPQHIAVSANNIHKSCEGVMKSITWKYWKISLGDDWYEHWNEENWTEITDLVPMKLNTNSEKTLKWKTLNSSSTVIAYTN